MSERPRVLLLTVDLPPSRGGIQTMLREICARTGSIVEIVAPGPSVEHGLDQRVRFARGPTRRARILTMALVARRAIARARPDVVLAMHPLAALGVPRGVPNVVVTHGGELRSDTITSVARRVLPRATRVVANSNDTLRAAIAAGADPDRSSVLLVGAPAVDGVPAERAAAMRASWGGGRIVLCVARLAAHKGHAVLIDALGQLPNDVRLVLVGDGPERDAIGARAASAGVADRLVLAGRLSDDDLMAAYAAADVFTLASIDSPGGVEGGGIVLLEAAAHGLPIVASDSGGIPETIAHERTGLLVPAGDPAATAAALARVLDDAALRERIAAGARAMATTERTWDRFVAGLERVLAEAVRA